MNARGRTQFAPTEKDRECEILCPFLHVLQARYRVLHLFGVLSGGNIAFLRDVIRKRMRWRAERDGRSLRDLDFVQTLW